MVFVNLPNRFGYIVEKGTFIPFPGPIKIFGTFNFIAASLFVIWTTMDLLHGLWIGKEAYPTEQPGWEPRLMVEGTTKPHPFP